ncbi:polysaccharide deacetylase family protein [Chryseolinea sp. T2]|uniref:polysaccharide deacetylase family protein n=1 Tax=Chryseolinea sp. T2 TaxID=3129255 RepID=UPI0030777887
MRLPVIIPLCALTVLISCSKQDEHFGQTEITRWKDNKPAAISITYDDASINQFRQALPIMDTLGLKGTFFINTADIPGSQFAPKFTGRPLEEIIKETATSITNAQNLFERASALRFLNIENAIGTHNQAGALYEQNKPEESFKVVDDAYALARKKKNASTEIRPVLLQPPFITWPEIKAFAANGHEFGSHTISHPRLAVLDENNMLYELEKCKEELLNQLGPESTFSAECPFGTENERVMDYALKVHPALRNRMPEPFLVELNRFTSHTPGEYKKQKEYIQWQRGPLKRHTVEEMKSYVDTLLRYDNVWLVLTFHGIDGVGWEAKPHQEHKAYFSYIKQKEDKLWVATFGEVTKYMRERMSGSAKVEKLKDKISINLTHTLDKNQYNVPLTLKTYVNSDWKKAQVKQGAETVTTPTLADSVGTFVMYQARPNGETIEITTAD